jgi:dipeptidyl-peptidase-4
MIDVQAVDQAGGWLYYGASPQNAAQKYLFRTKLDGSSQPERVTPPTDNGWNVYNISPNRHWAVQTSSSFGKVFEDLAPRSIERIGRRGLSSTMLRLKAKLDKLQKGPQEFFRVDIGDGVALDGWMMKPPGFDPGEKVSDLVLRIQRTGRPDRHGFVAGCELPLVPDAHTAGLYRRKRGQSRNTRSARTAVS